MRALRKIIQVAALLAFASAAMVQAQLTVTLYEGETKDQKLNCNDPRTGTATMTIADAGTLVVADTTIATASVIDPNGNNGQGSPTTGQVESPTLRFTGVKAGTTKATIDLSCPDLFMNTHGIGLGKHQWQRVTTTIKVLRRPDVPTGNGGGKGGKPADLPAGGQDPGTQRPPVFDRTQRDPSRFQRLPWDCKPVQDLRMDLLRELISRLQQDYPGDREAALAILQLRSMMADQLITNEEMDRAREIHRAFPSR